MKRISLSFVPLLLGAFTQTSFAAVDVTLLNAKFVRDRGGPVTMTKAFPGKSGPALIEIFNGGLDNDPGESLSSSIIMVNGQAAFGTSDFTHKASYLKKVISLDEGNNVVAVTLRGKPGGTILVRIVQTIQETVIDTLPQNCSFATEGALAQGGTFVASGTNLAEFTINVTMGIERAARPIVLGTTESGAPTLGPVLWEGPDVITPFFGEVTYHPNVTLTIGERYFIGLDYGFLTFVPGDVILFGCRSDNPIPDGQAWRAFSSGWDSFAPGIDIAARIVMQ